MSIVAGSVTEFLMLIVLQIAFKSDFSIILMILGINFYVRLSSKGDIVNNPDEGKDAILVLGAGLRNGKPSPILKDRLDTAIKLYKDGVSKRIIVSGDHGKKYYDEVNVMKDYLIDNGIDSNNIFMDHAGFSTYDSIYRAKNIFQANDIVIVTQEYHLYRSLYLAKRLGLNAVGVSATLRDYSFI